MPRPVVPIRRLPRNRSVTLSRVRLYEAITWALAETSSGAVDAPLGEGLDLAEQHAEVDHDAVADHRHHAGGQDAGRQQVQRVLLTAHHDGVPGVVAAVELDDQSTRDPSASVALPLPSSPHWAPTMTTAGTSAPQLGGGRGRSRPGTWCNAGARRSRRSPLPPGRGRASARRKPWLGPCDQGTGPWPFQPAPRRASSPRWYPTRA